MLADTGHACVTTFHLASSVALQAIFSHGCLKPDLAAGNLQLLPPLLGDSMRRILLSATSLIASTGVMGQANFDIEYLKSLERPPIPLTPIKPAPPSEYESASETLRFTKPWGQRHNLAPLDDEYQDDQSFEFRPVTELRFIAWSSTGACLATSYEVEVAKGTEAFTGVPNFAGDVELACPPKQECTRMHTARLRDQGFRVVPGGRYEWRGRIKMRRAFPIGPGGACGGNVDNIAFDWHLPTYKPAAGSGELFRSGFGLKEQWVKVLLSDGDMLGGASQDANDWGEATRERDGRTINVLSRDGSGEFSFVLPIEIENRNYVRQGAFRLAARADKPCDHTISLLLGGGPPGSAVIRRVVIDKRLLTSTEVFATIPIARSGYDLRSWITPVTYADGGMAGFLGVEATCKVRGAGQAKVTYDQFAIEAEAQVFFKRVDW